MQDDPRCLASESNKNIIPSVVFVVIAIRKRKYKTPLVLSSGTVANFLKAHEMENIILKET